MTKTQSNTSSRPTKGTLNINFNPQQRVPRASQGVPVVKNRPVKAGDLRDPSLIPGSGRSPGGGRGNAPVFSPGESHGERSLAGCSSQYCKESDMTEHKRVQMKDQEREGESERRVRKARSIREGKQGRPHWKG